MIAMSANTRHRSLNTFAALALGSAVGLGWPALFATAATLPSAHHEGQVTWLSGGIGETEAQAMKLAARQYPLELEFLRREPSGHEAYLASDRVVVRNAADKVVLDTTSDGPFLLAKLPPGKYSITATNAGVSQTHPVSVLPRRHETLAFEW